MGLQPHELGAGIFRGFSPGRCILVAMYWAPQEIRTYFVTTVTASRRRLFQVNQNADLLMDTLQNQRAKERLESHAFVVMPDHVHLILTPAPEVSLEKAMQYIKGGFSFRLKSKFDVWERSYDSRRLADPRGFAERLQYIHQNPVREKIAIRAEEYLFSSAGREHLIDPPPRHLSQWVEAGKESTRG